MNGLPEFLFRNVLYFFIERENHASARLRGFVSRVIPAAVGIGEDQHLAGFAANIVVERILDAAQPFLVNIHIAENVRGELPLRIEAPSLALKIYPAQIHRRDSLRLSRRQLSRDPHEGMRTRQARGDLVGRNVQDFPD